MRSKNIAPVPEICGFSCPHADFPPAETAGICHTMAAVWCRQLRELVSKNVACQWRRRERKKTTAKPHRPPTKARPRH